MHAVSWPPCDFTRCTETKARRAAFLGRLQARSPARPAKPPAKLSRRRQRQKAAGKGPARTYQACWPSGTRRKSSTSQLVHRDAPPPCCRKRGSQGGHGRIPALRRESGAREQTAGGRAGEGAGRAPVRPQSQSMGNAARLALGETPEAGRTDNETTPTRRGGFRRRRGSTLVVGSSSAPPPTKRDVLPH